MGRRSGPATDPVSILTAKATATPQVSILLPTHNRADVLGYAIQSVLSQSFGDFELLIVGDGCTDTTRDVVACFNDARIKWFDLPKAPLSGYANRNIVLRQAVGFFVAYAQHDDLWFPDHLAKLLDALRRADSEWVYSRPLWVGPDGVICPAAVNLTLSDEFSHFMNIENSIPSSCVMHLRSALERVGYWPEDQVHIADWVCWQRIIRGAAKPGVGYCQVPTSLHFRAIWRDFDSQPERAWRRFAQEPWWPAVLSHKPDGEPEQAVLWRAMAVGSDWINRVRDATQTVLDRLAWNAIRDLLPEIERAEAGRVAAEVASNRAHAHADAAHLAMEQAFAVVQQVRDAAAVRLAELEAQREAALDEAAVLQRTCDAAAVRLAELEAQREAAHRQAASDRAALEMIHASTMWRAMAPVRVGVDVLKELAARSVRGRVRRSS